MKKVVITYLIVSILGVSSIASAKSLLGGTSDIVNQTTSYEVCLADDVCANSLDFSFTNLAVSSWFEAVPAKYSNFITFLNRSKKLRISAINRTCTGFKTVLKV